jgi:cell division protein FtsQ
MTDREMMNDEEQLQRPLRARITMVLASLVLIGSLALVALDRLLLPGRFSIDEVIVTGDAPNVDPAAVLQAVRAIGPRSWFSIDLEQVESKVRQVPWVYRTTVRRRWPGRLVISVSQATPFARYNETEWIDAAGEALALPSDFPGVGLPRLSGPQSRANEVTERYRELVDLVAQVREVELRSLMLDARDSWEMVIVDLSAADQRLINVTIGRESLHERVARLTGALQGELAARLKTIDSIDLRYPNGFAVRPVAAGTEHQRVVDSIPPPSPDGTG